MKYTYTKEVYNHLDGIAYRAADNNYMVEKYGADGAAVEIAENKQTVSGLFNALDAMGVPFWVQNAALAFGSNWRRYRSASLAAWLQDRGITLQTIN